MKIIERIFEYIKYKGVTIVDFERKNALSNGYLRKMKQRNADIGETIIVNILDNCPDISLRWFVLGEGSMLKDNQPPTTVQPPSDIPSNDLIKPLLDRIEAQAIEIDHLKTEVENLKNRLKND